MLRPVDPICLLFPRGGAPKKGRDIADGQVKHLEPPDCHLYPLNPEGILDFWDMGRTYLTWFRVR